MLAMNVIGHGIDLVEIGRIRRLLDDHGERFLARCFTASERACVETGSAPAAQRYAARFAAKEAILKALGTGLTRGTTWLDMQILSEPTGKPVVQLTGQCAKLAAAAGISHWHLSLTHTAELASASVIACADSAS